MANRTYADLKATKPFRWWHEAIIDDMLAFPLDTLEKRGARLGRAPNSLSLIINSDMFQAMYAARREAYNERLAGSISGKTAQVADKALDIVLETLEKKRDSLPFDSLVELTDRTLARLGYGAKSAATNVQVNVGHVPPMVNAAQLAEARAALRAVENSRVIEHQPGAPSAGGQSEPGSNDPIEELV